MDGNLVKGSLLVAGTAIGGGMLALPVLTGQAGFVPSLLVYFVCWMFMALAGLLFLEISLWMKKESNIITMADQTLGHKGKVVAWGLYLFLFYCLTLAYIVGAGNLIADFSRGYAKEWQGQVFFLLIFGPFVYAGARYVGKLNVFLMAGLGITYIAFVLMGVPYVNYELLEQQNWVLTFSSLPITFTAFAYQGIIPTLVHYMHNNARNIRLAILIGSFLPFIAYVIWQGLILGIVPIEGPGGLLETMKQGQNAVHPLKNFISNPSIYFIGQLFAFFAIATSFFGVTLGLLDFLADGLKLEKSRLNRVLLCLVIFIPPWVIAWTHPDIFLIALDFAGGFGCALLLGLLPVLMVWAGRYRLGFSGSYQVFGGKFVLSLMILFVLFELACELVLKL